MPCGSLGAVSHTSPALCGAIGGGPGVKHAAMPLKIGLTSFDFMLEEALNCVERQDNFEECGRAMREGWDSVLYLSSKEKRVLYNARHKFKSASVTNVEKGWKEHRIENQLALSHHETMSGAGAKHQ